MSITLATPLGALVAVGVVVPLAALLAIRRRGDRVRRVLVVGAEHRARLLVPLLALAALAGLVGLAAAQPVLRQTNTRAVRTDAEVFFVLDVSRSMLAQENEASAMRIDRARVAAERIREALPDVRVGVASVTDRVLPHLFPSSDEDVFRATLERSIGIEKPPPRGAFLSNATKLDALAGIRTLRFFSPTARKRLLVVFTDGESQPVANARLGALFREQPVIETLFVHVWGEDDRVFSNRVPEPQYRPNPSARSALEEMAASTRGAVYTDSNVGAATRRARALLGSGPTVTEGNRRGRTPLAPFLAVVAFLPLGLLLWRRDR